jgi:hypothetical protein
MKISRWTLAETSPGAIPSGSKPRAVTRWTLLGPRGHFSPFLGIFRAIISRRPVSWCAALESNQEPTD